MTLSRIWRNPQIKEGVIHRGRRPRWITPFEICRILHILRKLYYSFKIFPRSLRSFAISLFVFFHSPKIEMAFCHWNKGFGKMTVQWLVWHSSPFCFHSRARKSTSRLISWHCDHRPHALHLVWEGFQMLLEFTGSTWNLDSTIIKNQVRREQTTVHEHWLLSYLRLSLVTHGAILVVMLRGA